MDILHRPLQAPTKKNYLICVLARGAMGGGCVECESKVSEELFEEHFSNLSFDISQEGWWGGGSQIQTL